MIIDVSICFSVSCVFFLGNMGGRSESFSTQQVSQNFSSNLVSFWDTYKGNEGLYLRRKRKEFFCLLARAELNRFNKEVKRGGLFFLFRS